jgi:hypothetical protein
MTRAELELLAELVADRLAARLAAPAPAAAPVELLDAHEAGRRLGRSAVWVRRHAEQLGAVRLGDGERPRLGFPADRIEAACSAGKSSPAGEPAAHAAKPRRHRDRRDCTSPAPVLAGLAYEGQGVPPWR